MLTVYKDDTSIHVAGGCLCSLQAVDYVHFALLHANSFLPPFNASTHLSALVLGQCNCRHGGSVFPEID